MIPALHINASVAHCFDGATISAVPDMIIVSNQLVGPLSLLVSNSCGQPDTDLMLFANSSDTRLVPVTNIVFGGADRERTVTITPAPGQAGMTEIFLYVLNKSGFVAQIQFNLTIKAVPDAPVISRIPSVTTLVSDPGLPVSTTFSVFDLETPPDELKFVTASSNPALLPKENILISGTGTNRTLTLTPLPDQFGTAGFSITVVNSKGMSAVASALLNVIFCNGTPAITEIPNQTAVSPNSIGPIPFIISGACGGSIRSLKLFGSSSDTNLIPNSQIVFAGTNNNRTVTITPTPNLFGKAIITIYVADKYGGQAGTSFFLTVEATNTPPTISLIPNRGISVNGSGCVSFSIFDAETPADLLQLSASVVTSPENLLPLRNVVFTGMGTNRVINLIPQKRVSGAAAITIIVRDADGLSATNQFTLVVSSCGQPPTISSVLDHAISVNHTLGPIAFRVAAPCTPFSELTVTGESSNTDLVPRSQIIFDGADSFRTVTITPAVNQIGSTKITLILSDGALSASTTFTLTVTADNTPPTISSIPDYMLPANDFQILIPFTISDRDTSATSLSVRVTSSNTNVVPVEDIVLDGTGNNRKLTFTPFPCRTGESIITVSVTDDEGLIASTHFLVTVQSPPGPRLIAPIPDQIDCGCNQSTALIPILIAEVPGGGEAKMSGHSSNPALVPDNNIFFGGQGTRRAAFISPALNTHGSDIITFTVTYTNGLSDCTSFRYTLIDFNNPPKISQLGPQGIPMNSVLGPLLITVGDVETRSDLLRLNGRSSNTNLVRDDGIALAGCGIDRFVIVTPIAGMTGTTTITLTVTDADDGSSEMQFPLFVSLPNSPMVAFDSVKGEFRVRWLPIFPEGIVQVSTNLTDWYPVATNQIENGSLQFISQGAFNERARFYRLIPHR
ncbi:MAG: hypothetical protein HY043_19640 [Verrucomicrobia bacterium]|nr:hypothetical protein [Verrucomicrobiota bacterium]